MCSIEIDLLSIKHLFRRLITNNYHRSRGTYLAVSPIGDMTTDWRNLSQGFILLHLTQYLLRLFQWSKNIEITRQHIWVVGWMFYNPSFLSLKMCEYSREVEEWHYVKAFLDVQTLSTRVLLEWKKKCLSFANSQAVV